jgi:hypothetical protein
MSAIRSSIAVLAFILGVTALTFTALGSVVLNEVDFSPAEDYMPIWVELYNTASDTVDISGWLVQIIEPPWRGDIFVPQGTVIQGNEYLVLTGDSRWVHGSGGVVILKNAAGLEVDRTPLLEDNRSDEFTWGRYPDGKDTGRRSDWAYIRATRGFPNSNLYSSY